MGYLLKNVSSITNTRYFCRDSAGSRLQALCSVTSAAWTEASTRTLGGGVGSEGEAF